MVINLRTQNRNRLSAQQKDFLVKAHSQACLISDFIIDNAAVLRIGIKNTLHPAVILADILVESQWGESQLAQATINGRYANNLAGLKVDSMWSGKKHNGYKTYPDWSSFAADYALHIVYQVRKSLFTKDLNSQLRLLAETKEDPRVFLAKAQTLIEFYELDKL